MTPHLENVQKGYAEVYFDENDYCGYVHVERFVKWTDFEKDEIHCVNRWVPYLRTGFGFNGYSSVGRETGYATRKEAIEALIKEIEEGLDAEDRYR